jgi:adenylylsulfate reductase, subunit B
MWTIKFRNGNMKRLKFPIRTTPDGSADPVAGKPKPNMADVESPTILFTNDMQACDKSQLVSA